MSVCVTVSSEVRKTSQQNCRERELRIAMASFQFSLPGFRAIFTPLKKPV